MNTILAPIDFTDATNPVLEAASALAHAFHAKIVIAHVVPPATITTAYSPLVERFAVTAENSALEQLSYWQKELQNDGFTVEISQLYGQPADCIREEAKRLAADYIVLSSHGHGALYNLVVGGTASNLLKKAPCPVLVVPATGLNPPQFDPGEGPEAQPK